MGIIDNSVGGNLKYPLLGIPQKAGNAFVVKDYAIVGKVYTVVCPQCKKVLLVKASSATPQKATCKECGAVIYFKGKDIPAVKAEEGHRDELDFHSVATQKYSPSRSDMSENSKSSESPLSENSPLDKEQEKEESKTTKFSKPNAKIVLGNIFNRKTFKIRSIGEYYIGRDDDEVKSDLMIKDDYVSRRSILLEVIPKGGTECLYKITVKHASNPILVNAKEIAIGESVYLNYGDTILVGNTTLTFKRNDK